MPHRACLQPPDVTVISHDIHDTTTAPASEDCEANGKLQSPRKGVGVVPRVSTEIERATNLRRLRRRQGTRPAGAQSLAKLSDHALVCARVIVSLLHDGRKGLGSVDAGIARSAGARGRLPVAVGLDLLTSPLMTKKRKKATMSRAHVQGPRQQRALSMDRKAANQG